MPITDKVSYADIVVDNSTTREDLEDRVAGLVTRLEKEAGWMWRFSWLVPPLGVVSALWTLAWRYATKRVKRKES